MASIEYLPINLWIDRVQWISDVMNKLGCCDVSYFLSSQIAWERDSNQVMELFFLPKNVPPADTAPVLQRQGCCTLKGF